MDDCRAVNDWFWTTALVGVNPAQATQIKTLVQKHQNGEADLS
jgi:hypothetical protein